MNTALRLCLVVLAGLLLGTACKSSKDEAQRTRIRAAMLRQQMQLQDQQKLAIEQGIAQQNAQSDAARARRAEFAAAKYPQNESMRTAITNGELRSGMDWFDVVEILGEPAQTSEYRNAEGLWQAWGYPDGSVAIFNQGRLHSYQPPPAAH